MAITTTNPFAMNDPAELRQYAESKIDGLLSNANKEPLVKTIIAENQDVKNELKEMMIGNFITAVGEARNEMATSNNPTIEKATESLAKNLTFEIGNSLDKNPKFANELKDTAVVNLRKNKDVILDSFFDDDNIVDSAKKLAAEKMIAKSNNSTLKSIIPSNHDLAKIITGFDTNGNRVKNVNVDVKLTKIDAPTVDWIYPTIVEDIKLSQKEAPKKVAEEVVVASAEDIPVVAVEQTQETDAKTTAPKPENTSTNNIEDIKSKDAKTVKTTAVTNDKPSPKKESKVESEKSQKTADQKPVAKEEAKESTGFSVTKDTSYKVDPEKAKEIEKQKAADKKAAKERDEEGKKNDWTKWIPLAIGAVGALFGALGFLGTMLLLVAVVAVDYMVGGVISEAIGGLMNKKEKKPNVTNEPVVEKGQGKGKKAPVQELENQQDVSEIVEPENLRKPVYKLEPTEKQIIEVKNNTGTENAHKAADKLKESMHESLTPSMGALQQIPKIDKPFMLTAK